MAATSTRKPATPGVVGTAPTPPIDKFQAHNIKFDEAKLTDLFVKRFSGDAKFAAANGTNLVEPTRLMAADPTVTDVRWMVCMLATAYWETAVTVAAKVPKKEKGKPVLDKAGQPVMKDIKVWRNMTPTEEDGLGKGRKYELAVKIAPSPGGGMEVIEQDGDTFQVSDTGKFKLVSKGRKLKPGEEVRGALPDTVATSSDSSHAGTEHSDYGRGYVQLTWWNGYADARAMVNGSDCAAEIAKIAKSFEDLLLESKVAP